MALPDEIPQSPLRRFLAKPPVAFATALGCSLLASPCGGPQVRWVPTEHPRALHRSVMFPALKLS
eukprot:15434509-Alexandrium_andersonii.AAC.1